MTEIWTHGGAGGVSARLEDLDRVAAALRSVAAGLAEAGARVVAAGAHPGWTATAAASPGTFAVAEAELARAVAGPAGLGPLAARLEGLGDGVALAAHAYRAADAAAAALIRGSAAAVARVAGFVLAGPATPLVVVLVAVRFRPTTSVLLGPNPAAPDASRRVSGTGRLLDRLLWGVVSHGRVSQQLLGLIPPAVDGALSGPVAGSVAARLLGTPPASVAEVAALLGLAGAASGRPWLNEPATDPSVLVRPEPRRQPGGLRPPTGLADLVAGIPSTREPAPRVHLERIDHADGRRDWVVGIPGTSDWSPQPSPDPFDLTTNVQLMAGRRPAAMVGVLAAMRQAGVGPGEPVMLAGHSQGGIIAADLAAAIAADPRLRRRFTVTQVVTTGAPIAAVTVPRRVHVLSLEHVQDPVPQLDAAANPDRPGWLTVTADVRDTPQVRALHVERPLIGHDQQLYQQTAVAVDASGDPSVARWRAGAAAFVGDPDARVTGFDATVSRVGAG